MVLGDERRRGSWRDAARLNAGEESGGAAAMRLDRTSQGRAPATGSLGLGFGVVCEMGSRERCPCGGEN